MPSTVVSTANVINTYFPPAIRETWSVTIREEHRLRMFENRVLRWIFEPKRDKLTVNGENGITRSFMICTLRKA
jgi:hypothetical protein